MKKQPTFLKLNLSFKFSSQKKSTSSGAKVKQIEDFYRVTKRSKSRFIKGLKKVVKTFTDCASIDCNNGQVIGISGKNR